MVNCKYFENAEKQVLVRLKMVPKLTNSNVDKCCYRGFYYFLYREYEHIVIVITMYL